MEMMKLLGRSLEIYRTEGPLTLAWRILRFLARRLAPSHIYNQRVRPFLPRTEQTEMFNGVEVRPFRRLDSVVPWRPPTSQGGHRNPPKYERGMIAGVRSAVGRGDNVVVVGGGLGVSTVIAAETAGETGNVRVFEGARQAASITRETAELNGVGKRVTVDHAIVADAKSLNGLSGDATVILPEDLPPCDVLVMDCEGAETNILDGLIDRPRAIVVETHRNRDRVEHLLTEDLAYSITDSQLAEDEPYRELCEDSDIYVLIAVRID